jgi:light-regulated signal transduction histidine kinase (bacteriophytochrome)
VTFVIADGLFAECDHRLLSVALENLIGNAWKFTGRRADARIEIGVMAETPPVFFVRDNGAGFDMSYASKLFGVFQRLHSAKEYEGTGIGLATVQRIVRRHGGRIWAESKVGEGATFFFTLEAPSMLAPSDEENCLDDKRLKAMA